MKKMKKAKKNKAKRAKKPYEKIFNKNIKLIQFRPLFLR